MCDHDDPQAGPAKAKSSFGLERRAKWSKWFFFLTFAKGRYRGGKRWWQEERESWASGLPLVHFPLREAAAPCPREHRSWTACLLLRSNDTGQVSPLSEYNKRQVRVRRCKQAIEAALAGTELSSSLPKDDLQDAARSLRVDLRRKLRQVAIPTVLCLVTAAAGLLKMIIVSVLRGVPWNTQLDFAVVPLIAVGLLIGVPGLL